MPAIFFINIYGDLVKPKTKLHIFLLILKCLWQHLSLQTSGKPGQHSTSKKEHKIIEFLTLTSQYGHLILFTRLLDQVAWPRYCTSVL